MRERGRGGGQREGYRAKQSLSHKEYHIALQNTPKREREKERVRKRE
jgi:hypothetical protein